MKTVRVPYRPEPHDQDPSFFEGFRNRFVSRIPGGVLAIELREAARIHRKLKTAESRTFLRLSVLRYWLGSRLTNRRYADDKEANDRFARGLYLLKVEYTPRRYLYHYAPKEVVPSILKEGLLASRTEDRRNGLVFMTYAPKSMGAYMRWKASILKRDIEFVPILIDAKRLAQKHKLYYYREGEVVTDHVEPEFLTICKK